MVHYSDICHFIFRSIKNPSMATKILHVAILITLGFIIAAITVEDVTINMFAKVEEATKEVVLMEELNLKVGEAINVGGIIEEVTTRDSHKELKVEAIAIEVAEVMIIKLVTKEQDIKVHMHTSLIMHVAGEVATRH